MANFAAILPAVSSSSNSWHSRGLASHMLWSMDHLGISCQDIGTDHNLCILGLRIMMTFTGRCLVRHREHRQVCSYTLNARLVSEHLRLCRSLLDQRTIPPTKYSSSRKGSIRLTCVQEWWTGKQNKVRILNITENHFHKREIFFFVLQFGPFLCRIRCISEKNFSWWEDINSEVETWNHWKRKVSGWPRTCCWFAFKFVIDCTSDQ
jgi:hypothetical protein